MLNNQRYKRIIKGSIIASITVFCLFLLLNFVFPLRTDIEYSTVVTAKDGSVLHAFLTSDDKWRMVTELEEITPQLEEAIIHKEDKYFYYHFGINPLAIVRATYNNVTSNKRTSGASTITMQVARLLSPKERTYWNKVKEMFHALQLEWKYSKKEVLQLYLNLVPYGSNIEGVKAASILYFDKSPNHLSIAELTALSIIPNRPNSLTPGKDNERLLTERNRWLQRFMDEKVFDEKDIADALDEPLNAYRHNAPKTAPHFSYRMKIEHPGRPIIKTHIDPDMQLKLEKLAKDHVQQLYWVNIKNAALMMVNNKTGAVEAYVGSADFFNSEDAGQVDGIRAIRSPGSTLKPLLYGLGFDEGLITPKSTVLDVPISYGGYEPENYDSEFHGKVTVEKALASSLNIPAVEILYQLGVPKMVERLEKAQFEQIKKDKDKLGLSVVLGGCGVTLEELTRLYATLGNGGVMENLIFTKEDEITDSIAILSPAAAFMLTEILTEVKRPDLPNSWRNTTKLPTVAWKTGTSYGRKDAWSIGYNKNYTIGVWVGNFSSEGVPELNGAEMAAPLLFKAFNTVDNAQQKEWYSMPNEVDFRLVCSETGKAPNHFCENQVIDYYIPLVSKNLPCDHLQEVWLTVDSTIAYCTQCRPGAGYKEKWYPNHPARLLTYFNDHQIEYDAIPTHNPDCERLFAGGAPEITSPVDGIEYLIDLVDSSQVMLSCNTSNDVSQVYWYVNDRFIASANAGESIFVSLEEGNVKLSCTDDKGRNSNVWVDVKHITF